MSHRKWSPPFGGGTHNCLLLPDRDLLVILDEAVWITTRKTVKATAITPVFEALSAKT